MKRKRMIRSTFAISLTMVLLLLPQFAATATTLDAIRASVIDSNLLEKISNGDASEYTVMVSLTNDELDTYSLQLAESNVATPSSLARSSIDTAGSLEEIQAQIRAQRAQSRAFYQAQNQAIINDIVDPEDVEYVSHYSPVAFLKLSPHEINQLALNNQVSAITSLGSEETINIAEEPTVEAEISAPYTTTSATTDYMSMIKASRLQQFATGNNIIIGTLESGIPHYANHSSLGVAGYYPEMAAQQSDHAVIVSSIIQEVAPDSTLYCAAMFFSGQEEIIVSQIPIYFVDRIEWLVDQNVNIINMTGAFDLDYNQYTAITAWLDHITYAHAVTLVTASGLAENGVDFSAMTYNGITVGSVNADGTLCSDSAYTSMLSAFPIKPDLCAPGHNINAGGKIATGTSVAAPQVAGVIALMMEYDEYLLLESEAIKAILVANVNKSYPRYTTELTSSNNFQMYGAGIIDCSQILSSLRSQRYLCFQLPRSATGTSRTYSITLHKLTNTRIALVFSNPVNVQDCYSTDFDNVILHDLPHVKFEVLNNDSILASSSNQTHNVIITSVYNEGDDIVCTLRFVVLKTTANYAYFAFAWCP